jgi:hypothetical protein
LGIQEAAKAGKHSMNWDYSCNVTNVTELYINLFKVMEEHNLEPNQIINLKESSLSIVALIVPIIFPLYW